VNIKEIYPNKKLVGFDNDEAVLLKIGSCYRYYELKGIRMGYGNIIHCTRTQKYDVVFTAATLLLIERRKLLEKAIRNIVKFSKRWVILIEMQDDDLGCEGLNQAENQIRMIRDYKRIMKKYGCDLVEEIVIPLEVWPGKNYTSECGRIMIFTKQK